MTQSANNLFEVMYRHAWICSNTAAQRAITHLLEHFCENSAERSLIVHLLEHFHFADERQRSILLDHLLDDIIVAHSLVSSSTLFIASAADNTADSSQKLMYDIKTALANRNWSPVSTMNRFLERDLRKKLLTKPEISNVVIVDDFSGTGKTICQRYQNVVRVTNEKQNVNVYVMLLVGMRQAAARLDYLDIPYFIGRKLPKGITHTLKGIERRHACELMMRLEKRLLNESEKHTFPRFGYGWAQALYCPVSSHVSGNVPNSVFPVFWWPKHSIGGSRESLLHRAEGS